MYRPISKALLVLLFILCACTPRLNSNEDIFSKSTKTNDSNKQIQIENKIQTEKNDNIEKNEKSISNIDNNYKIISDIEVILPEFNNRDITKNLINSLELSIYKKNINNISFNINTYSDLSDLNKIIEQKATPGKIFIGPLTSLDTKNIYQYCKKGVIFFSFASNRELASDCVYLINFFPEDDLFALFKYFDSNDRIALLYPDNHYGNYLNNIIDQISITSDAVVVNKISYKEDLTNAREAIKRLGQYDLRKKELERQKKILINKNDEISLRALKKIEKFETIGELNFTHVIIADYNIRLLEIVPLLPFYDIDPKKIQFVGTGVWDEEAFFDDPSLQNAIFPGIIKKKRSKFIKEYLEAYRSEPIRTATIVYDLTGLLSYIISSELTTKSTFAFLDNQELLFEGIDGKFIIKNNLIKRYLNILKISDGKALLVE